MAARIEAAGYVLTAHLAEEEDRVLPLAAAHFSQREWDALGKHGWRSAWSDGGSTPARAPPSMAARRAA
jgi:hypothetical protein